MLYASDTNQTRFRLVNAPVSVESTSDLTPVTLEMGEPGETRTCATYNSSPPQDESDTDSENMTMEPCANRATPETSHKSQVFMYNGTSGTIEPTWNSDGADAAAASPSVNQNSTSSSSATVTSSAVLAAATLFANRADTPQNTTKQNSTVSLVFTPIKAMITDVGIQENSTTTASGTTMTMTKTVTVFNVKSTSTSVPSSSSNTAAQVAATSSALEVQLVGTPIPPSTTTGSTSVSTSSGTATGFTDASAIASRIAASAASSASADGSSTTMNSSPASASPSSTQAAQRRDNGRMAASRISTEPYTWMFKAEER